jgi:steroid 5-alpha reductase family enzyme
MALLRLTLLLAAASVSTALVAPSKPRFTRAAAGASVRIMRGGSTPPPQMSAVSLVSSAFAMPSILGATVCAAIPCGLAFIRQAYVFSLSYGLSAAAIGGVVLSSAWPVAQRSWLTCHAGLVSAYGLRLFGFLLWRQAGQDAGYGGPSGKLAKLDKTPRAKRAPLILFTSFFYALLASPLVFHAQAGAAAVAAAPFGLPLAATGAAVATCGLILEGVADLQKSLFKIQLRRSGAADRPCTGGVYTACRHPNYLGEMAFWTGSFLLGLPAILAQASSLPVWRTGLRVAYSGLGLTGIVFIMLSATKRLEARQAANAPTAWPVLTKSGEVDSYSKYVARSCSLVPGF